MTPHPQCEALWTRAHAVLAGGPATLSKLPSRYPLGLAPKLLTRGDGAHVWCPDGQRYVDAVSALGPIILGHAHPAVTEAVWQQAEHLACSTLSTPLETEVAEILCDLIPGAEMVRFASNGADVCNAAVKVARYVTGKKHVIFSGYHGGGDSYLSTTDKSGGLLLNLKHYNHQVPFADWDTLAAILDGRDRMLPLTRRNDLAALMVEVPPVRWTQPPEIVAEHLHTYQTLAREHQALLIFDEVVTGFRYALGGAQEYYGVTGDLTCVSKALANGYPCAAITGPRGLMQAFDGGKVFCSTTFGAQPVGLAAAKATLTALRETDALARLQAYGQTLAEAFVDILETWHVPLTLRGNHARMVFDFCDVPGVATADEIRTLWLQELVKRGILASVPWFPMSAWSNQIVTDIMEAAAQACEVIERVMRGQVGIGEVLECPVIHDVFQGRYRPQEPPA